VSQAHCQTGLLRPLFPGLTPGSFLSLWANYLAGGMAAQISLLYRLIILKFLAYPSRCAQILRASAAYDPQANTPGNGAIEGKCTSSHPTFYELQSRPIPFLRSFPGEPAGRPRSGELLLLGHPAVDGPIRISAWCVSGLPGCLIISRLRFSPKQKISRCR
jgi:hypothetical protein